MFLSKTAPFRAGVKLEHQRRLLSVPAMRDTTRPFVNIASILYSPDGSPAIVRESALPVQPGTSMYDCKLQPYDSLG
jgi:hypothetical protein